MAIEINLSPAGSSAKKHASLSFLFLLVTLIIQSVVLLYALHNDVM